MNLRTTSAKSNTARPKVRPRIRVYLCATAFLLIPLALFAQEATSARSRAAQVLDSMPHAKRISEAAISPDGTQVAYIVDGELTVTPASGDGGEHTVSVAGNPKLRDAAWSPDSKTLVFIADLPGESPSAQLWTAEKDGSNAAKHAELKGYVQALRYSPDGSKISFLFIEGMPRVAGPLQPMTPLAGVVNEKIYEQRIATIDLSTSRLAQVTPADMYVYEYDWTPDGQGWVVSAAEGAGDANWWVARLYLANAQSGALREIYKPNLQIADPRVSPDGKYVAFIQGLMSDEGSTGGDIYIAAIDGGEARNLTPNLKASPAAVAWTSAQEIIFAENVDGNSGFGQVNISNGAPQGLWSGEESATPSGKAWSSKASSTTSGRTLNTAIVRQSASSAPEVWAGAIGKWKQITELNEEAEVTWGEMRNVHWMDGNLRVQGWLMLPKDFDGHKKYPLIVNVHGGPSAACMSRWDERSMGPQSTMGYFALCPNARGTYGQGEAFTQANVKDFGGGDFRDIMAGVDSISKQYPIDTHRIGIRGHSYGGYMTMWAETQTQRFAAAVAGAGLSDWLSYYGLNDIDEWMVPFFGASIYQDPAVYNKSDPIRFVTAVKTPTLILVGDRDGEVPMEQSVEWWHALDTLRVPAKLVVYPNEGHAFIRPADARDYTLRSLEWFEQWFAKAQ
ncbi:MAG: S9 family peptidase [Candidatus Sulfotelmatobacter sp.]